SFPSSICGAGTSLNRASGQVAYRQIGPTGRLACPAGPFLLIAKYTAPDYNIVLLDSTGDLTMWKRKILKKKARLSMRQNYWRMIAVCFIITMLTTAYPTTTTFLSAQTSSLSPGPQ